MRNRRRKLIVLGLVLVVVLGLCAILVPSGPPDPVYQGKRLSYWLRQPGLAQDYHPPTPGILKGGTFRVFSEVDTNAIPYLLAALRNDNGMHKYYAPCWNRLPGWLQKWLPAPVPEGFIRQNAIYLLTQLGDDARPAIPALADIVRNGTDREARDYAIFLLGRMGKGDLVARQALIDAAMADPYPSGNALEMLRLVDPVAAARLFTNGPPTLTNAVRK